MKTDKLSEFTRKDPKVLAVKLEPGLEDNWVALDPNGRELSRSSTEEGVRNAAPNAEYRPIVDLPGLEGKPLTFGDYLINDGDGTHWTMPAKDFEEQYAAGKGSGKKHGSHDSKLEWKGKNLSPEELLQELKHTEDERAKLDKLNQQLKDNELLRSKAQDPDDLHKTLATGQLPADLSQEPILVIDQTIADLDEGVDNQTWIEQAVASGKAQGVTLSRVSLSDDGTRLLYEGWLKEPEDQGRIRWGQPTNPTSSSAGDNPAKEHEHDADPVAGEGGPDQLDPAQAKVKDPLDHDDNGKKGGAKKPAGKKTPAKKSADKPA